MAQRDIFSCSAAVDNRPVHFRVLAPSVETETSPVLLLHGLGCSSAVWMPALSTLERLGAGRLAVAPDFPGCGRSSDAGRTMDIAHLAEWSLRLLDRLDIPFAHVAAHSMGCQVALAMARNAPNRIGGLVLVGPTLGADIVAPWRYALGLFADVFVEKMLYNGLLAKMYCEMGIPHYCATTLKMFADRPLESAGQVDSPTLVLRGSLDAIVPDTSARRLAAALPRARFERVARCAHALLFNRPEFFAARLERFLAGVEAAMTPCEEQIAQTDRHIRRVPLSAKIREFAPAGSIREESTL